MPEPMSIFLVTAPGLESLLAQEAAEAGFAGVEAVTGGVTLTGGWDAVARANRELRGAARVLVRIAEFRAFHLAQLDKRARRVDWAGLLRPDVPVRVEATCRKSKIYHDRAAAQRLRRAISDALGASGEADGAGTGDDAEGVRILLRIEDDLCTVSVDTSGAPLHRRGHKEWIGKAPLRETMAAMFLRDCGYRGDRPVVDPMCGSGTFVLEAAEMALGLAPGRARRFDFERLAVSIPAVAAAADMRAGDNAVPRFHGYDRDDGAVRGATANAARAGLSEVVTFERAAVSDLVPPEGPPGLVMVNPPYGARIGNRKLLFGLYGALGRTLAERFGGWQLGMVTSDEGLARATGLTLSQSAPVMHGPLRIKLYKADIP